MACTICQGALPHGEWCRVCGEGLSTTTAPVKPMTGLRLAIRIARGGPLSSDGPTEREAFAQAMLADADERHAE